MNRVEKVILVVGLLTAIVGSIGYQAGSSFVLIVALGVAFLLVLLRIGDSLRNPTEGKLLWVAGIVLIAAPFVSEAVPPLMMVVGVGTLVIAGLVRRAEVLEG